MEIFCELFFISEIKVTTFQSEIAGQQSAQICKAWMKLQKSAK